MMHMLFTFESPLKKTLNIKNQFEYPNIDLSHLAQLSMTPWFSNGKTQIYL